MKLQFPKIEMHTFYLWGAILMSVSTLGGFINAWIIWGGLNIGGKISTTTGVLFTMLWVGFFTFLYKNIPRQPQQVVNSPEIDDLLTKLKEDDKNGKKTKR